MGSENHRALLAPKLADKLESRGLDDEMLEVLMEKEGITYGKLDESQEPDMPRDARFSALFFLRWCTYQVPEDPRKLAHYINAVQLFDLAAHSFIGSEKTVGPVWALAAAAWSVSIKMNSSSKEANCQLSQLAALAETLVGSPAVAPQDIEQKEKAMLLKCNVSVTAPSTWCSLFSTRLDAILNGVLTKEGHLEHLDAVLAKVLTMAVETLRVSRSHPPYTVAVGSFCLALVAADLLPEAEVVDLQMQGTSTQTQETASVQTTLAWMKQNLGSPYPACIVPSKAMTAAAVVALHSNAQDMKLATTNLVKEILLPRSQAR